MSPRPRRDARRALGQSALLVLVAAAVASGQEVRPRETTDLVNALLSGLLGFRDVTGPELQREVEEAGGVPFRSDVRLEFLSPAQLGRYLRDVFDSDYPEAQARAEERALRAFDLLPAGTDLRALRARVLEENIVGFYDERPGRKRLYAVSEDDRLTPANQLILSHELRHALQDQYVDLRGAVPETVGDYDDRRLAWLCLLEGDATLVMERFLLRRLPGAEGPGPELAMGALPAPVVPDVPPVVRDQLVRPYLAGLGFARQLWARGGADGLRAAWERPPLSTEQVLHPSKYLGQEAPRAVPAAQPPPGGRLVAEGVLGEMLAGTLLEEESGAGAAGWGGDRYWVFDLSGRTLLLWRTVWDTPADAEEFLSALRGRFARHQGTPVTEAGFSIFRGGAWSYAMGEEEEGGVLFVSSDDSRALEEALGARRRP